MKFILAFCLVISSAFLVDGQSLQPNNSQERAKTYDWCRDKRKKVKFSVETPSGKIKQKSCAWVRKKKKRCGYPGKAKMKCPVTCNYCQCRNNKNDFMIENETRNCKWVEREKKCNESEIALMNCPKICGQCKPAINYSPSTTPSIVPTVVPTIKTDFVRTDKLNYSFDEGIQVTFQFDNLKSDSWIAIYPASEDSNNLPSPSIMWQWHCGGTAGGSSPCPVGNTTGIIVFSKESSHGNTPWPLCDGEWKIHLINDQSSPYKAELSSEIFYILKGDSNNCVANNCVEASTLPSTNSHAVPEDGQIMSRIAFSSCYKPDAQTTDKLWNHVRSTFQADVWNWLGDNIYSDGTNMERKRQQYNKAKNDQFYSSVGPIASPKIPVTGTWDDHDYGANNQGDDYKCPTLSQNEFVNFFDIPTSDPRHPSQGANQQKGVYSSYMFNKPNTNGGGNGIHLLNLDARTHRSPTYTSYGQCRFESSTMLGDDQWTWLKDELQRISEIKVIGSGIQVLPPTDQKSRSVSSYCAYDGSGGTFDKAIADVGEGVEWLGTDYESWAEIPQERTKLLQLCQKSINDGFAKKIIFISGDQHWGEIMAKKMPASSLYGDSQVLYEVTASGIDQNWIRDIPNSNRVRVRSAGDGDSGGLFHDECNFPFKYDGTEYNQCTNASHVRDWCSTQTDSSGNHVSGNWGDCDDSANELVPRDKIRYSGENICTDNYMHVCSAKANYGGVSMDWDKRELTLSVFTPHETVEEAAAVVIDL